MIGSKFETVSGNDCDKVSQPNDRIGDWEQVGLPLLRVLDKLARQMEKDAK